MEEFYSQLANADFFGGSQVQILLLGFFSLGVLLFHQSTLFQRLVVISGIGRRFELTFAAYGVPVLLVLTEIQRVRGRGGGLFRFVGIFLLVVIAVIVGVLALIAFLIYRFLRRGRR